VSERQVSSVWDAALPNALTLSPVLGRDNTTVLVGTDSTLVCIKISDGMSSQRSCVRLPCAAILFNRRIPSDSWPPKDVEKPHTIPSPMER
jgi:hypothetical protein